MAILLFATDAKLREFLRIAAALSAARLLSLLMLFALQICASAYDIHFDYTSFDNANSPGAIRISVRPSSTF